MEKRLRILSMNKWTKALVLVLGFTLLTGLPSLAFGLPPNLFDPPKEAPPSSKDTIGQDSSSGDPIDGERKFPILDGGGRYELQMYGCDGDPGSIPLPPSTMGNTSLRGPRSFIIGIPGITPIFRVYLPF
ncbi:MAG: hypothetical protein ABIF77_07115 [bacterium]